MKHIMLNISRGITVDSMQALSYLITLQHCSVFIVVRKIFGVNFKKIFDVTYITAVTGGLCCIFAVKGALINFRIV